MPDQVREVLAHIEAGALLPPLVVLQTLAVNPHLNLAVVKGYMARTLSAEGAPDQAPSTIRPLPCFALPPPLSGCQIEGRVESCDYRELWLSRPADAL